MKGTNYHKVGVSTEEILHNRLATIQTGNPIEVVVSYTVIHSKPYLLETEIHSQLEEFHIRGEWFYIELEQLIYIVNLCATMFVIDDLLEDGSKITYPTFKTSKAPLNDLEDVIRYLIANDKSNTFIISMLKGKTSHLNTLITKVRQECA